MHNPIRRSLLALFACFFAFGCTGKTEVVAAEPTLPDTPDGTVRVVAEQLAANHPEILWEALPESYRTDINELTLLFAEKMDPEIYDRAMSLGLQIVQLLQDKQEIILASNTVAQTGVNVEEMGPRMAGTLAVMQTFLSSEVSTIAGLGAIDWQQYLENSGSLIMEQADAMDTGEGEDPFEMLETLEVETLVESEDTAKVLVTVEGHDPEEIDLVRVEGRWVPAEMAEEWPDRVAEARERLTALSPEEMEEIKGQAMLGFAMADGFVGQFSSVQTTEEFDTMVGPLFEGLMGSLGSYMPGAAEEAVTTE